MLPSFLSTIIYFYFVTLVLSVDRSKNTKSAEDDQNEENQRNSELGENAVGSGMFKHMKSIDDKVNQV